MLGVDLIFLGSGSIRGEELGPIVQYQDLMTIFPYNDEIYRVDVNGEQLRRMISHVLRDGAFRGETEFYQYSRGLRIEYDVANSKLLSLSFEGKEVCDEDTFTLGLQSFHLRNIEKFFNVTEAEVSARREPKVLTTSCTDVLEEYFSGRELVRVSEEKRLVLR